MVTSAVDLYDKLLNATDERTRARILAEAFEALEERFPNLSETATRRELSETELRLTKEIEQIRGEIKELELKLTREIEQVRVELADRHANLLRWSFLFWASQFAGILLVLWRIWGQS